MKLKNAEEASVLAFRCPTALRAAVERQATSEGISCSDVVRRATIRDLRLNAPKEPARWIDSPVAIRFAAATSKD
jgi:hypothetical protein